MLRSRSWGLLLLTLSIVAASALAEIGWAAPAGIEQEPQSPVIPLGPTPAAATKFCRQRARLHKFVVLCPTRYPIARGSDVAASGVVFLGPSFYWASFNDEGGFGDGDQGHLIFGGQRHPFSLAGSPGETWPRPGQPRPVQQLPLPRLITTPKPGGGVYVEQHAARMRAHTIVAGRTALILLAPPYPDEGISGYHVVVVWNWHRHGYMLSFHFAASRAGQAYTLDERIAAALAVARSFAPMVR